MAGLGIRKIPIPADRWDLVCGVCLCSTKQRLGAPAFGAAGGEDFWCLGLRCALKRGLGLFRGEGGRY